MLKLNSLWWNWRLRLTSRHLIKKKTHISEQVRVKISVISK